MNLLGKFSKVIKERDQMLIKEYCDHTTPEPVCKPVEFNELLNTLHNNDVVFIEMVKSRIELEANKSSDPKLKLAMYELVQYLSE